MTNAEKFLKNGKATEELIGEMGTSLCVPYCEVADFWNKQIKPTLTEDERVILRNINTNIYDVIGRDLDFDLYIAGKVDWEGNKVSTKDDIEQFLKDNVFQFIKERRRIRDKGVIKRK